MVGVTGFEPAASWSRTKRSTKLSHTPVFNFRKGYYNTGKGVCQAEKAKKEGKGTNGGAETGKRFFGSIFKTAKRGDAGAGRPGGLCRAPARRAMCCAEWRNAKCPQMRTRYVFGQFALKRDMPRGKSCRAA